MRECVAAKGAVRQGGRWCRSGLGVAGRCWMGEGGDKALHGRMVSLQRAWHGLLVPVWAADMAHGRRMVGWQLEVAVALPACV